jgi:hypothetical protein
MKIEPPEVAYVTAEESADSESRIARAFDIIFRHLLEQYRMKKLEDNKKGNE